MRSLAKLACALTVAACSGSTSSGSVDAGSRDSSAPSDAPAEGGSSFAGTYLCSDRSELKFTTPAGLVPQEGMGSSTYVSVENADGTYTSTLQGDSGQGCALRFTVTGTTGTLLPGETCEFKGPESDLTLTYTSSTIRSTGPSDYVFTFTGTVTVDGGNVAVAGTGTDSQTCQLL